MIEKHMLADPKRVESVKRRLAEKTAKNEATGCIEWTAKARANGGYGVLCVGRAGHIRAHRAAWVLRHGPIPEGIYVCHACDNPICVNVAHLFLGTPKENNLDKEAKGRGTKPPVRSGESHHLTKLTADQVAQISSSVETLPVLAARYGVSTKTVWRIKKGLTWTSRKSIKRR